MAVRDCKVQSSPRESIYTRLRRNFYKVRTSQDGKHYFAEGLTSGMVQCCGAVGLLRLPEVMTLSAGKAHPVIRLQGTQPKTLPLQCGLRPQAARSGMRHQDARQPSLCVSCTASGNMCVSPDFCIAKFFSSVSTLSRGLPHSILPVCGKADHAPDHAPAYAPADAPSALAFTVGTCRSSGAPCRWQALPATSRLAINDCFESRLSLQKLLKLCCAMCFSHPHVTDRGGLDTSNEWP